MHHLYITVHTLHKEDEQLYTNDAHLNRVKKSHGLPGKVWEIGKRVLLKDIAKSGFLRKKAAKKIGLKSIVGIPLLANNQVVGVLLIGSKREYDDFGKFLPTLERIEEFIGSEIKRKKLETDLSRLFNSVPELISTGDFEGRFLQINRAGGEILGYSEDEIIGQSFERFIHPDDLSICYNELKSLERGASTFDFEVRFITKKNNIIWLSWFCTPNFKEGLIYSTAKNITEEKELRELNRQVGEMAKIGSWEYDLINNTIYWSDEVHKIHGTDPKSYIPTLENALAFYKGDYVELVQSKLDAIINTDSEDKYEAIIVNTSNKEVWVQALGKPEFVDGKCVKLHGSLQDITEKKEAELRLKSLADNLPGVMFQFVLNTDGSNSFRMVSEGSKLIWGFAPEEVTRNSQLVWGQVALGGELEKVQNSIETAVKNDTDWTYQWVYVMPTGEKKVHRGYGSHNTLVDGTVICNSLILDVTAQAKSEELLDEVSSLAKIGSWEVDLRNNTIYWSDLVHQLHGTDPQSYVPDLETAINFYRADFRDMVEQNIVKAIKTGESWDIEGVIVDTDKQEVWVRALGEAEFIDGECVRLFGSFQDITERKTMELRLKSLSDDLPGVTFQYRVSPVGEDSRHFTSNASHKIWGVSPEESERDVEIVWEQIKKGGDFNEVQKSIEQSMTTGEKWHFQWRNMLPSGELRWHEGFGTPNYLSDGTVVFNSMIFDITERKQAEQKLLSVNKELKTQARELERSNEELEQFAFITSHDLQEPLRMISSFMEQLKRKYSDQLDDKALQYIHFATDGAKRMKQIILDLLLYSRVNRPSEEAESVDLNTIIAEFLQLRRKLIAEKKAVVKYDQLPSLNTYRAPVTQIFHSLLDNALKYSREKVSPVINISVKETGKFYEFAVEDNGIGIDEKFYDKIFIIFQRLNNRADYDGTGIGLSVTKRAVEFLGGKIWVESVVGKGSTFNFTIKKT